MVSYDYKWVSKLKFDYTDQETFRPVERYGSFMKMLLPKFLIRNPGLKIFIEKGFNRLMISLMKTISISQLKTHLSREIHKVEKGNSLLITDHDHPVAILTSVKDSEQKWLQIAEKPMKTIKLKFKIQVKTDPLDLIREERNR